MTCTTFKKDPKSAYKGTGSGDGKCLIKGAKSDGGNTPNKPADKPDDKPEPSNKPLDTAGLVAEGRYCKN